MLIGVKGELINSLKLTFSYDTEPNQSKRINNGSIYEIIYMTSECNKDTIVGKVISIDYKNDRCLNSEPVYTITIDYSLEMDSHILTLNISNIISINDYTPPVSNV